MKTIHTFLTAGVLGLTGLLSSCSTTPADSTSALTCDKCKTVWVRRPVQVGSSGKGSPFYVLRSEKAMDCPDCESAAATFFKTGTLKHHCSHCGGGLTHCTSH